MAKRAEVGAEYPLDTIFKMLDVIPTKRARAAIGLGAFCGMRLGEVRGARWEDINGGFISVKRSVWRKHVSLPKKNSSGTIPVIQPLAKILSDLWEE